VALGDMVSVCAGRGLGSGLMIRGVFSGLSGSAILCGALHPCSGLCRRQETLLTVSCGKKMSFLWCRWLKGSHSVVRCRGFVWGPLAVTGSDVSGPIQSRPPWSCSGADGPGSPLRGAASGPSRAEPSRAEPNRAPQLRHPGGRGGTERRWDSRGAARPGPPGGSVPPQRPPPSPRPDRGAAERSGPRLRAVPGAARMAVSPREARQELPASVRARAGAALALSHGARSRKRSTSPV